MRLLIPELSAFGQARVSIALLCLVCAAAPQLHGGEAGRNTARQLVQELEQVQLRLRHRRQRLETAEQAVNRLLQRIYATANRLHDVRGEINRRARRREQLQREVAEERGVLADLVRKAYAIGGVERGKGWGRPDRGRGALRRLGYPRYLVWARSQRLLRLSAALEEATQAEMQLAESARLLIRLQGQLSRNQRDLEQTWRARAAEVALVEEDVRERARRLELLRHQPEPPTEVVETVEQSTPVALSCVMTSPRFVEQKGHLPWPFAGTVVGRYGAPQEVGSVTSSGVLIEAHTNVEVRAVSRGRVAFSDWLRGFGLLTVIDHGDGYMSLYGYNDVLYSRIGDWVEAGEPIARIAPSGQRATARLYFEIRHQGKPLNPAQWCVASGAASKG